MINTPHNRSTNTQTDDVNQQKNRYLLGYIRVFGFKSPVTVKSKAAGKATAKRNDVGENYMPAKPADPAGQGEKHAPVNASINKTDDDKFRKLPGQRMLGNRMV